MSAWTAYDVETDGRWRELAIVGAGILLAFAPWFSASAVSQLLAAEWHTSGLDLPLLTVAVQVGFAVGAIAIAITGAADVVDGRWLYVGGAIVAAAANLGFAFLATSAGGALIWRALTGAALAAVYPIALRMIAGWFARDRGVAIGLIIGALTVGSALPHLIRALGAGSGADWRVIVAAASVVALGGAAVVGIGHRAGPLEVGSSRFSPSIAASAFGVGSVRLANLGYLGHMWELYAMWTWLPLFVAASFAAAGVADPAAASAASFAIVAIGGIGCIVAGALADRLGRTTLTIAAMTGSCASALVAGFAFGAAPAVVTFIGLFWGLTVVADSAQFSAAVSELAPPGTSGSALSLQLALGFLLTAVAILAIGALDPGDGSTWRIAFWTLAIGPAVGIAAMWRLRGRPDAIKMAGGNR
ncbi:MAG TPA: MFS transporter [Candidatus Limnocylindrales bacterium]|nr:MFS transporter [Candidatus Limnocylindrales bacterium]